MKAVEIVRAKDVSHPDECSRWLIPSYRGIGRAGTTLTSLRSMHMLSGKAISRAVRAIHLLDSA